MLFLPLNRAEAYHARQYLSKQAPNRTISSDQKQRNASPSTNVKVQSKQRAASQQAQREKYTNPHHSGAKYDALNESKNVALNNSNYAHQPAKHSNNYSFDVSAERSRSSYHKERPQLNTTLNYVDQRVKSNQRNTPTEGKLYNMKQNSNARRTNSTKKY